MQLRKYRQKFGKINHIFISHIHGDHVFGIFGLITTFSLLGRKHDLHVYAHEQFREVIDFHLVKFAADLTYDIIFHVIPTRKTKIIFENDKLSVLAFPLKHRIPCSGFVFREKKPEKNIRREAIEKFNLSIAQVQEVKKGMDHVMDNGDIIPNEQLTLPDYKPRAYAYCTDTKFRPEITKYLHNVDILYHEATFAEKDKKLAKITYHSTARQAATIAKEASVGKLLVGHFSSRYKDTSVFEKECREIFPDSHAVNDGDSFEIPRVRVEGII
jgi:ribonuclease Z